MTGLDLFLMIVVKPFVFLAFFLIVALIALGLRRIIPDGRIKRILFSPLPGHSSRGWEEPTGTGKKSNKSVVR